MKFCLKFKSSLMFFLNQAFNIEFLTNQWTNQKGVFRISVNCLPIRPTPQINAGQGVWSKKRGDKQKHGGSTVGDCDDMFHYTNTISIQNFQRFMLPKWMNFDDFKYQDCPKLDVRELNWWEAQKARSIIKKASFF